MTAPAQTLDFAAQHLVRDLALSRSEMEDIAARVTAESEHFLTPTITDAYAHAKATVKAGETTADALRKVLLTRMSDGTELSTGAVQFVGTEGTVEARPRVSAKLDPAKMTALLNSLGLYSQAVDEAVTVKDPVQLRTGLQSILDDLRSIREDALADALDALLKNTITQTFTLNEKKLDKLAKAGTLPAKEAAACYTLATTYALYDTSA